MKLDLTGEWTLRALKDWVKTNEVDYIAMTLDQEFWYRGQLGQGYMVGDVNFMGIPIRRIYEGTSKD